MNKDNQTTEFQFDLTKVEKIDARTLTQLIAIQACNGGKSGHEAMFSLSCDILVREVAYIMSIRNGGKWEQEIFSNLGDDLKKGIELVLEQVQAVHNLVSKISKEDKERFDEMLAQQGPAPDKNLKDEILKLLRA